jgi:predicted MFS family arabinose efflux permease
MILVMIGQNKEKMVLLPPSSVGRKNLLSHFPLFENKTFFMIYLVLFFVSFIFAQLRITYPLYLKSEYHLSTQLFSYLFLLNTIFIVAFQVSIVDYASKFNQFVITGIGSCLVGIGMLILIFGHSYSLAIISCLIWTMGEILAFPIIQMLLYHQAKEHNKATHMGMYQAIYSCANVVGPVLGSVIYKFHNGLGVWIVCGVLGVVCLYTSFKASYIGRNEIVL